MKVVFEASTGLDAHMICNLLEQADITARVDGEYLQGGVGDLQAINFIKVLVRENDYINARAIIKEWESQQAPTETIIKSKSNNGFLLFFIGLIIGVGASAWAYNSPVTKNGIDYNGDGVLDEKWIYRNNRISQTELDRNFDTKIDFINYFDRHGIINRAKADDDFDGIFETEFRYKMGNFSYQESDLNHDGKVDYKVYYKFGILDKVQIIGNSSVSPKKWQQFNMGKLVSAKYDSNGDGNYDIIYEYDYFEEIK